MIYVINIESDKRHHDTLWLNTDTAKLLRKYFSADELNGKSCKYVSRWLKLIFLNNSQNYSSGKICKVWRACERFPDATFYIEEWKE
jgi:hypothetical protein